MFRKRIGDQSESKIDSDKIPAKKDQARFAGPLRGAFGIYTLLNAVIDLDQFKLTIVCFRTYNRKWILGRTRGVGGGGGGGR